MPERVGGDVLMSLKDLVTSSNMGNAVHILEREGNDGNIEHLRLERIGKTRRYHLIRCDEFGKDDDCDKRPRYVSPWVCQFKAVDIKQPTCEHFFKHVAVIGQNCLQVVGDGERVVREG